jgi:hypothetical protein
MVLMLLGTINDIITTVTVAVCRANSSTNITNRKIRSIPSSWIRFVALAAFGHVFKSKTGFTQLLHWLHGEAARIEPQGRTARRLVLAAGRIQ